MGFIQASTTLLMIVGVQEGITKKEILKLNRKTFQAKIEKYWDYLDPNQKKGYLDYHIQERNGRYYLSDKCKEANKDCIPSWKEHIEHALQKNRM